MNRGRFDSVYELYASYPMGGVRGDYADVAGERYYWWPDAGKWSKEGEGTVDVDETGQGMALLLAKLDEYIGLANAAIDRASEVLSVKFSAHEKGYFSSLSALRSTWPSPVSGDWAVVRSSSGESMVYGCMTDGTWTLMGSAFGGVGLGLGGLLTSLNAEDAPSVKGALYYDGTGYGWKQVGSRLEVSGSSLRLLGVDGTSLSSVTLPTGGSMSLEGLLGDLEAVPAPSSDAVGFLYHDGVSGYTWRSCGNRLSADGQTLRLYSHGGSVLSTVTLTGMATESYVADYVSANSQPKGSYASLSTVTSLASRVSSLEGYLENGVAKSAEALRVSRKLWGQSFDGSADVSGNMSGVGTIRMSGRLDFTELNQGIFFKDSHGYTPQALSLYNDRFQIGAGMGMMGHETHLWGTNILFKAGWTSEGETAIKIDGGDQYHAGRVLLYKNLVFEDSNGEQTDYDVESHTLNIPYGLSIEGWPTFENGLELRNQEVETGGEGVATLSFSGGKLIMEYKNVKYRVAMVAIES